MNKFNKMTHNQLMNVNFECLTLGELNELQHVICNEIEAHNSKIDDLDYKLGELIDFKENAVGLE